MSTLYITECKGVLRIGGHFLQIVDDYGYDMTPVTISGSHAESAAFRPETKVIRVNVDTSCSIAFGSAPVATTNNRRMSAGQTEYFPVNGGDKISVISNT